MSDYKYQVATLAQELAEAFGTSAPEVQERLERLAQAVDDHRHTWPLSVDDTRCLLLHNMTKET